MLACSVHRPSPRSAQRGPPWSCTVHPASATLAPAHAPAVWGQHRSAGAARQTTLTRCAAAMKLVYFDYPGRGECSRIMLGWAGIEYEDVRLTREEWSEIKTTMPFHALPVLEVDGKVLAQSHAIQRYVAALAGLLPQDPWEMAKMEEAIQFMREIFDLFLPTYALDTDARFKARQEIAATTLMPKLIMMAKLMAATDTGLFGGSSVNYADFVVFNALSNLVSGSHDGVPRTILDDPALQVLKAHHNRVAALPGVAKRYEGVTEGLLMAYKPLP